MHILGGIYNSVLALYNLFWDLFDYLQDWIPPFPWIARRFLFISDYLWGLLNPIYLLDDLIYDITTKIVTILTSTDIWNTFSQWFTWAEWAWSWVQDAAEIITYHINAWWTGTSLTVKGWIDAAVYIISVQIASLSTTLTQLQAAVDAFIGEIPTIDGIIAWFSNWSGNVLSVINSWWTGALLQVQSLINSAFVIRESLWAGWQDWRGQVAEFFPDPLEFLWTKFADWFLGPEV